ncbi:RND family efflux transporter MFP subunit [Nitritalea halalkaliphila LW7]|uniref:RND family efflux transporter MFP subunit n=1 Tax=Nitritalea halalkaliphila LW7 TaxID=1189621 RepID=I5C963_9BACT|nr:efflux RND transporter periplasmic adaptor subunit [Nitritalea halalkaliphila]EIM78365.1 RND family efflux transporter MFP subunit [Nitritalea halalkaliphila LW7]
MKRFSRMGSLVLLAVIGFSCGSEDELSEKKAALESLKKEYAALATEIEALEKEVAALDPEFGKETRKTVLITTVEAEKGTFQHFVEVSGAVLSKKNVNISGEVSGRVQEIVAVEGMQVKKGAVLARIDAESVQRNMEELETQLDLARTVFEKQERLWEQEIGTEIQYLEAKNRKEQLEKNLASLQTQMDRTTIRAPFNGTVEMVNVRLGELVQPGTPMFQFIGDSDLFIEADLSERYIGSISRNDEVEVRFPSLGVAETTKVTAVGAVINQNNRTFKVEARLPDLPKAKPNMIAVLRVRDYQAEDAVIIPNYLILQDNKGDYVYVVESGQSKKRYIKRGMVYQERTEILEGLQGGETLVDKGFRDVGDNFNVSIAS